METIALPLRAMFHPLGFPVQIETNSERVLEAARESWSSFRPAFSTPPTRLRVAVTGEDSGALPPAPVFRGQAHLFVILSDAGNFAVCDYTRNFAFCWLTPGALADPGWVRFHFLEALAYSMLSQLYVTPVHAACVSFRGRGVLLCGGPGAGKSSLAFACAVRGWTYVSDDTGYLVRESNGRVIIGKPFQFRFRQSAAEMFPELGGRLAGVDRNGKLTFEVRTQDLPGIATAPRSLIDRVVFLHRHGPDPARLEPVSEIEALDRLLIFLPLYDPALRERQEAPIRNLLGAGAFELRYGSLDSAVRRLEQLVEEGR
jgi:hypothetical protein